ncbi:hypothetical protein RSO01_09890 [Reyranella soli]|jgi:hypothetical protein|uniref:Uncharacterized protein n=1 Tax=Reyranella soli TaxID=1230389 RepID=A0A512N4E3_9HYPH|nr:hypothetical protein RSO01_09890 [Reyranella soli]
MSPGRTSGRSADRPTKIFWNLPDRARPRALMTHEARKDARGPPDNEVAYALCATFARTGSFQPGRMKWQV